MSNGQYQKIIIILISTFIYFIFSINLAGAIDYPTKPVNLIVSAAAGGTTDMSVRAMSDKLAEKLGGPVLVVNKGGSGGLIGGEFVVKSKPDGYTILVLSLAHIIRQVIDPKMPFDVLKDFEPICLYVTQPLFLVVKGDSRFNTVENLIEFGKKNPGKLSMGSAGIGATSHFSGELFKAATKTNFKHVPFTGEAPCITALMGGHIDFMVGGLPVVLGKVTSGDIKALASFDEERSPELKDVPILKERGYPEAIMYSWFAFVALVGTPKEIIEKLNNAFQAAIKDPTTMTTLKKIGFKEAYKPPAEFAQFVKSEYDKFDKIAKSGGIFVK